jgi:ATP adenylyltransferase
MKQLWAPWRMPFVEGSNAEPGCLFCRLTSQPEHDEENYVLFRSERCFVMLNLYPYNSGHLMVVPYQHTGEFRAIEPETASQMMTVAQLSTHVLSQVMGPEGFNLGVNQGAIAGAGIADHVHLHVVPRWGGDTNFMPVLAETKVMPELLTATAAKLRPLFARDADRSEG